MEEELRSSVRGEVRTDRGVLAAFSVDASNYRHVPSAVVSPVDVDDAVRALGVCAAHGVPVVSRGGGTSLAGQTTGNGVVIDWTRHCTGVVSVDPDGRRCVVEPGIALDDLNRALAPHGLMFGPRPATHRSCTIGGMVGNNSCGSTAQAYGKTVDNVHRLEVLTADGERMWVGPTSDADLEQARAEGGRRAEVLEGLRRLRDDNLELLRTRYPDIPRRVSGYNLDSLLPERGFHVARALVGSEGTLVTVLHAELDLVEVPTARAMVVLGYADIATAADAVPEVLEHDPWLLEGVDQVLLDLEKEGGLAGRAIDEMPTGGGWLIVQFAGDTQDEVDGRARALVEALEQGESPPSHLFLDDPAREDELMTAREAGLGATAHPVQRHSNWPGWEDSAVAPERLGDYLRDLRALLDEFGYSRRQTSLYGHFGQGCVHTRIPFELRTAHGIERFRQFTGRAAELCVSYGGSLSGEHGDGQARGDLLTTMFGPELVGLFGEVKQLLDPEHRMNPGRVVLPEPRDEGLRLGTSWSHTEPITWFGYPEDEGRFSKATMRCVGVGNCRSSSSDGQVMCPSFQVTRDEVHSTRGRARLLFEMMRGTTITDGWRSTRVRDALDLCLACKGCKSDCPVSVDMATYKAEFLAHHYRWRPRPLAHYSMGWLPLWARLAARAPKVVNALTGSPRVAPLLKRAGGIAAERDLPAFAGRSFVDAWSERSRGAWAATGRQEEGRGRVLLWPDTFSNAFHPEVLRSAVTVLEDAGFSVSVPEAPVCCGLTWVSTGQLATAQRVLRRTVRALRAEIRAGAPVVVLEPSCAAMLRNDAPELLGGDEDVRRLARQTRTLAETLRELAPDWEPPRLDGDAIVQTHCHQHAVLGSEADDELMAAAGLDAERLQSGCCGLAGNFGFEEGHYEVSRAAGERVLLPRVREADDDTAVLADGFSCRTQIEQGDTGRRAVHLAELLAEGIHRGRTTSKTTDQSSDRKETR